MRRTVGTGGTRLLKVGLGVFLLALHPQRGLRVAGPKTSKSRLLGRAPPDPENVENSRKYQKIKKAMSGGLDSQR